MKKESVSIPSGIPPDSAKAGMTEVSAPSVSDAAGGVTIDFHSAEFSRTDDLNDFSGNYRTFESLDGIVTADMRHQMERLHSDSCDSHVDDKVVLKEMEVERDKTDVFEVAAPLTVISRGRTLIVDADAERAIACGKLLNDRRLTCTLVITKRASAKASFSKLTRPAFLETDKVSITGAFGGFSAAITVNGEEKHLMEPLENKAAVFDLVLDLQPVPSFRGSRLPIGYYAPGVSTENLDGAIAELPEMRGRFKKPQFTSFRENHCLHGRSRNRDCRRCLEICPFGAIQSVDRKISIDHYICQGCGGCAMLCPADAVCMVQPTQEELLKELQSRLITREVGVAFPLTLLISGAKVADANELPARSEGNHDRVVRFAIEEIGYAGLEMFLAALAYGAGEVVVACGPQNPPGIRKAVEWQIQMARAILTGLGLPENKIRFDIHAEENGSEKKDLRTDGLNAQASDSPMPTASFSPGHDKRTLVRLAVKHLYDQSGAQQSCIPLPAGSPFGAVAVGAACTLCMACTVACPSGALSAGADVPRLVFRESRCHQCGLCEESCPESAIKLLPRLLCDPDAVEVPTVLREAEPFRCIKCGVPFAAPVMITRMEEKLKGHWMYADERQLRRLRMCSTCRRRDALTSEDMKSWNR
jgi:Pyruvate/2-oxoacid:ferredoxin oxidoreductase delta subunit